MLSVYVSAGLVRINNFSDKSIWLNVSIRLHPTSVNYMPMLIP